MITASVVARFYEKAMPVPEAGCWLWDASLMSSGYGQLKIDSCPHLAHRVSWAIHRGPIPSGMQVCHRCDTPACVNPDHLFLGSSADNVQDMCEKGRHRSRAETGERAGRAKITDAVAARIFAATGRQHDIADRFGVNRMTVSHIKRGRQWNCVTGLPKRTETAA